MINADMIIGFKVFREKFTTRVTLNPPRRIDVEYLDGPFKYLNNHWIFKPIDDGACEIDFYVDFEFKSILLQKAIGAVFNEAVQKMINAFEARAHRIYGNQLKT
jgi:coenzyme Q-binding protein COQ10